MSTMENEHDITQYFIELLESNRSIDMAEAEFKRILADDEELRLQYRQWCSENGHTPRNGFTDFADEYYESKESIWDTLNDYDDEQ